MREASRNYDTYSIKEVRHRMLRMTEGYEGDKEIRGIIAEIGGYNGNFLALQTIFDKHMKKSGVNERRRLKDMEIIQFSPSLWKAANLSERNRMRAFPNAGLLLINDQKVRDSGAYYKDLRMTVLHLLVHEFGHLIGDVKSEMAVTAQSNSGSVRITMGLEHQLTEAACVIEQTANGPAWISLRSFNVFFRLLNEAVNDLLAKDIVMEYVPQVGFANTPQINKFYSSLLSPENSNGFFRLFLSVVATKIAIETGMETGTVENAFRRGMLEGINLARPLPSDKQPPLDEITEQGFSRDLASIKSPKDLDVFTKKYGLESFLEQLIASFQKSEFAGSRY